MSEKGRLDRGRVEEKQRASEKKRGRERERDSRARLSSGVQEWLIRIVGSRSIDDRIGKEIVTSYVASCQPLWNHEEGGGGGKRKSEERWFVGYRRIALSSRVSFSIGRWVEIGRDHRSIRTGEGNEGGLERVISKVEVYIYIYGGIRSCRRSCCVYCAFWIFEKFYSFIE